MKDYIYFKNLVTTLTIKLIIMTLLFVMLVSVLGYIGIDYVKESDTTIQVEDTQMRGTIKEKNGNG